ncbi:beta strand repeat-containing protein [Nocardioides daeguensis]|uniref:beta strand repeat-containing protein n=2 Tax=Nocardioides daeguensis TaxID=908359 RepID=UPI00214A0050|nr:Ig-like domain-containing protein [Nocardioides daeguensis]MBV6729282.1 Ig-like domain-containing protein [Nocardioides daeguensis]MCR1774258.1 Ig-like domain-containing protein [Nocardioides daeguensis]
MKGTSVRRMIAALAATTLGLGVPVVLASSAAADITAPANGAVLRGNATLSSSGVSDGSACLNATKPNVTLQLVNGSGTVVYSLKQEGTGAKSVTIDTHGYPNGPYTVRSIEQKRSGTLYCKNSTSTFDRSVTIDNISQIAYSGATEGPQNTSVTVRATLTDPHLSTSVLPNQTVTFALAGGTSVNATTNASGVATASLPLAGPPRSASVTASFSGTSFYTGSSTSTTFEVQKNPTTTTLLEPAPAVHGQAVSLTAQVAPANGTSTPTGTVQFTVDGDDLGDPVAVSGGVATSVPTTELSTGNHTVGARYSGDDNLVTSTAEPQQLTIGKAPTSTVLTSTGSPTVSGEAVTFIATVGVVSPGAGDPAGGVQFNVDGEPFGTAVPLSGDTAALTVTNLTPGNHVVQATYNGNVDFAASSSAEVSHGVNRADTTVSLSTSNPDAVAGEPLTFTADVAVVGPGAGEPTGSVQFFADGQAIGSPVPLTNGSAVSAPAKLDAGDHVITANYTGDTRFAGAAEDLLQEVAAARTTTVVEVSPSPSVVGQSVTVRATVTPKAPATGQPVGAVQFVIDGQAGTFVTLDAGVAEITTSTLSRGSHQVKAVYLSADPNFVTSTSETVAHQVNKAATRTTVTSSAPTSVFGQPVTLTATVGVLAPGAGSPSGTITFTDGDTVLGSAPVSSATGGAASVTIDSLSVGQHAVVATYDGDDSFTGSNGSVAQKVQRAQTSTVVSSTANPSQPGAAVRFTATVSPVAPGAGVPGGTVQFKVNGAALGAPVALVDSVATSADFANLAPGTYRISAVYSGEPRFVASTGLLDQGNGQTVAKAGTATELASDDAEADAGQTVTFTATVRAVAPATGKPTGVVQFWDGTTLLGATSLAPSDEANTSTASFATATLTPGTHEIRASYGGSVTFDGSTASTSQVVGAGVTVVGIASSANPSTYGDRVTLTAVVTDAAPAAGKPTGTVTFRSGSTVLGTATLATVDGQQQARLEVDGLAAGTYALTAAYSGDASRAAGTSPALSQVVQRAATHLDDLKVINSQLWTVREVTATLRGPRNEPLAGQELVFSTNTTVSAGYLEICRAVTDANGYAKCKVPPAIPAYVNADGFTVTFAGNASYLPATDHGGGR